MYKNIYNISYRYDCVYFVFLSMKKTIAMMVGAMLAPMDADVSKNELSFVEERPMVLESKDKTVEQEISKTLDLSPYDEDERSEVIDGLEYKRIEYNQELSKILDIDNHWVDWGGWGGLDRQAQIQNLISQIKEPIILGDLTKPNVAITIDDGYWVESINFMLNLFEKYNVKATFFVIWECLKLHPELWRKAAQQWHEICNHTATHSKYFKTWNEPERFEKELLWWEDAVKMVLWEDYFIKMKRNFPFFRFPWMHWIREKAYLDILKKHGYIPIGWWYTENPKDGIVSNWEIFLWHFKDQDMVNVENSLKLILEKNEKFCKPISDLIFTDEYDTPIDWTNYVKKKKEAQANNVSNSEKVQTIK